MNLLGEALDLVRADLDRYVVFPSPESADAVTLWIAATHCQSFWEHATRLVLKSPVKRCGKTRCAEVARELVHNPLATGNITAAALARSIPADDPPTVFLDDADSVFGRRGTDEKAEALRSILNVGFARGWPYIRSTERGDVRSYPTYAMAFLTAIGDLPDTVEDRAVVVSMQRRAPGEKVAPFRQRDAAGLHTTRIILEEALKATIGRYESYEPPEIPVTDRAADVWEPLVVIADEALGSWPARARMACLALAAGSGEEEVSLSLKLLADLELIWNDDEEHLASATILKRLHGLEESPWADYYGRPLNPRDLARLLRPYQVASKTVRLLDGTTAKGYSRPDLYPVWTRYTHTPEEGSQATQASQGHTSDTNAPPLTWDVTEVAHVTHFQGYGLSDPTQNDTEASQDELPDPFDGGSSR